MTPHGRSPLMGRCSCRAKWRLFHCAEYRTPHPRARTRTRSVRCAARPISEYHMLTWISKRPPLRGNFSFQGNMATVLFCAVQNSPPARARVRCAAWPTYEKRLLTWKTNRPPRRGHLSSQGDIATLLFCTGHYSPPARARVRVRPAYASPPGRHQEKTHVNLETQTATAKGPLKFPRQHGGFCLNLQNADFLFARARARRTLRRLANI